MKNTDRINVILILNADYNIYLIRALLDKPDVDIIISKCSKDLTRDTNVFRKISTNNGNKADIVGNINTIGIGNLVNP
jgi:hypothetical protein